MSLRPSSTGSCSTSEALLAIRLSFMVAGRTMSTERVKKLMEQKHWKIVSVPKFRERGSAQSNEVLDGVRGDVSGFAEVSFPAHPGRIRIRWGTRVKTNLTQRAEEMVLTLMVLARTLLDAALHRGEDKKKMKKMQSKGGSHRNGCKEKELASEMITRGNPRGWGKGISRGIDQNPRVAKTPRGLNNSPVEGHKNIHFKHRKWLVQAVEASGKNPWYPSQG
ncbi:hypothetical protein FB451DRAFT_1167327 [Mycena latifolia]|nr:hypothetical protein FB451DRAFT_1167327 [Mycena latifolia]